MEPQMRGQGGLEPVHGVTVRLDRARGWSP